LPSSGRWPFGGCSCDSMAAFASMWTQTCCGVALAAGPKPLSPQVRNGSQFFRLNGLRPLIPRPGGLATYVLGSRVMRRQEPCLLEPKWTIHFGQTCLLACASGLPTHPCELSCESRRTRLLGRSLGWLAARTAGHKLSRRLYTSARVSHRDFLLRPTPADANRSRYSTGAIYPEDSEASETRREMLGGL
jgi:hypothetical protein